MSDAENSNNSNDDEKIDNDNKDMSCRGSSGSSYRQNPNVISQSSLTRRVDKNAKNRNNTSKGSYKTSHRMEDQDAMQSEKDDEFFSRRDYERTNGLLTTTQKTRKTMLTKKGKPPLIQKNNQTALKNSRGDHSKGLAH